MFPVATVHAIRNLRGMSARLPAFAFVTSTVFNGEAGREMSSYSAADLGIPTKDVADDVREGHQQRWKGIAPFQRMVVLPFPPPRTSTGAAKPVMGLRTRNLC